MAHIALYRAWRPRSFQEIVGQEHIVRTLQNSLKEGRISHAYLFAGPRGTGKTSVAKILAKAVNCQQGPTPEPCNQCQVCKGIGEGSIVDVVEIDAASNRGVEEIRDIRDKSKYAPTQVRRKVYIIDEVHMLTTEAFNALLKTLEEPPDHVMFILATTEPYRIPATIISRCQRHDFRRVPLEEQMGRLEQICRAEGIEAESRALHHIARLSDGGMRDALSILDQIVSFAGSRITYDHVLTITGGVAADHFREIAEAVQRRDAALALEWIEERMKEGKSAEKCLEQLILYFRDLLLVKMVPDSDTVAEKVSDPATLKEIADRFTTGQLFQIIETLQHYQGELKYVSQPQTLFEIALLKLCASDVSVGLVPAAEANPAAGGELDELKRRVEALEKRFGEWLQKKETEAETLRGDGELRKGSAGKSRNAAPSRSRIPQALLEIFKQRRDSEEFLQIKGEWGQMLKRLRSRNVSVYAWLVNGEPVSAANNTVLVAFKNTIHRDTTEKPANKEMIEQVMGEQYNKTMKLATIMQKEWQDLLEAQPGEQNRETLELVPETPGKYKEDWINEAVRLFGEDMVVVKDD